MIIKARQFNSHAGASQRNIPLDEARVMELLKKAGGATSPRGTGTSRRRPAISEQLIAVYPNAHICLKCSELARIGCGTGYCRIGPRPQNYPTLIGLIQDGACPLAKHQTRESTYAD